MNADTTSLRETAASFGLTATNDGWHGPFGLYGIERDMFGLLRAVGPDGAISSTGVTDAVASDLLASWCPEADGIEKMVAQGSAGDARDEAATFVRAWDLFAPGAVAAREHA